MKVSSSGRLLELLSLLQARPRWTAEELAERMKVTTRTVRRDVTRLRDLGYPVEADPGPLGGYQLGSGGALPPLLLADDEAVAVAIGLRIAATSGMGGPEDAAIAALAKLEQVLPSRLREQVRSLTGTTVVLGSRRGPDPVVDPDMLLTLAQGCRNSERLRFVYTDRTERVTERRVEPFRLVSTQNRRWYLVAFDLDRDDWRTFRVDRLSDAELTGHRFHRTEEPDAAAMVSEGIALAAYAWQAEILLHIDYARAAEEVGRLAGRIEPAEGGGTLLRLGADSLEWIARYLAGLPFDFEIIGPPELRKTVRAVARRLLRVPAVGA
jgi:predicted DNA-binding transcriptional regulator YafY